VCSDALFSNDVDETNILLMTIAKQIGEFLVRARGGVVFPTATSPMTVSDQGSGVEKELWQISQRLFKRLAAPASCLEARRLCAFNLPVRNPWIDVFYFLFLCSYFFAGCSALCWFCRVC
jgi:hypothetical protein